MNKYQIGETTAIVVDGELYIKANPLTATAQPPGVSAKATTRRGRPKSHRVSRNLSSHDGLLDTESDVKGRLQQEDIRLMKEQINAGYGAKEIARKFDVTPNYVYVLKNKMKKDGELVPD